MVRIIFLEESKDMTTIQCSKRRAS